MDTTVPLVDLERHHKPLEPELRAAFQRVLARNRFVNGPEVAALEEEWARWNRVDHAVACSSGSTALFLALRACGIGPGDEVVTSAFTFIATVEAIELAGARPVLADVDPATGLMTPTSVERVLTPRTAALVVVHLYGQCCDMDGFRLLADRYGLVLIEDACQAHGARWRERPVGTWSHAACYSFYPTKNLGGLGDGGMVVTNDAAIADACRKLRDHGRANHYRHVTWGFNFRMSEFIAAFLRVKLPHLEAWNRRRNRLVDRYHTEVQHPQLQWLRAHPGSQPAWHLAVLRSDRRDDLARWLARQRIGHAVHYPLPVSRQPALKRYANTFDALPGAEQLAREVLAVPLFPEMTDREQDRVIASLHRFLAEARTRSPDASMKRI